MAELKDIPAWKRPAVRIAQTRAAGWYFMNIGRRLDPYVLRATGGRFAMSVGAPILLLEMTGAKSGKPRSLPLVYATDGDRILLVASKGGDPKHPAWYRNLKAHPHVSVLAGKRSGRYVAHEAEGAERDQAWEAVTRVYPGYNKYQERAAATRTIPVMILEPEQS